MGLRDTAKTVLKKNLDVKAWIGAENLKRSTKTLTSIWKDFFFPASPKEGSETQAMSFEEAMHRYGLNEDDIKKRTQHSLLMLRVYLFFFILMIIYMAYLLIVGQNKAAFFDLVLIVVLASFMFKESFNYIQMKQHRLGLSLKDWLNALLRGTTS